MADTKTLIEVPAFLTVRELASLMGESPINVIKELMANGIMANINQQIDFDTAAIVAGEMGFDAVPFQEAAAETVDEEEEKTGWRKVLADESAADLQPRPPVVTMLGHVDHGKTS
ncbi:MAG TPA: translation initiation factor IF-2 N-terminal domain-containing protein, partial [Promineifilum sp.]|nr:translation initiation factor IF-2 N-terminal domain-containing protein [Promineifilum sp.]